MIRMTDGRNDKKGDKVDGRTIRTDKRGPCSRNTISGQDKFEKWAKLLMLVMKAAFIPVYRSKKSNHIYTYQQKIALLVLRQRLRLSYRQFEKDLPSYRGYLDAIGLLELDRIPDYTTLCRFSGTVDHGDLYRVVNAYGKFCRNQCRLALDGTGFSNFNRSAHYAKRCLDFGLKKDVRTFTKGSLVTDTDTLLVVSCRFSPNKKHDITFVGEHVKDLMGMDIKALSMDKGYDSEPLHKSVRSKLKCDVLIPCRESRGNRGYKTKGFYRNRMLRELKEKNHPSKKLYNRRSLVETSNYMVKTHNGSEILSKKDDAKITQGICKVISHNTKLVVERNMELPEDFRAIA